MPPSAPRRPGRRFAVLAIALTTATTGTGLSATAVGSHQLIALQPAAVQAVGASLPFTIVEAENSATNGTRIGPSYAQGTLAAEASNRQAVTLNSGQYVEFTAPATTNAITVAYSVPDGRAGSLSVYVDGQKLTQQLAVTSRYSFLDTSWIAGSRTHKLYDHARLQLGRTVGAGAKIKLQVDGENTAGPYTIDDVEFEQVAGAAARPAGSIAITDRGADPSGAGDSTGAVQQAIDAARGSGGVVWIPPGRYRVGGTINPDGVTIRGAGHWHSVLLSHHLIDRPNGAGNVRLHDFAVIGDVTERNDHSPDNFVNGSLGPNSVVSGLWLQHLKVGLWLTGNNDNLVVENNRFYDLTADGLNLNGTAYNAQVRNNYLRNTGDDALAAWSLHAANRSSVFANNTIVQPNLANGIAIYGGTDLTVRDNLIQDTNPLGGGIAISNQSFGSPFFPLAGTITVSGNTLLRTGAMNPNWGQNHPHGALRVDAYDSPINAQVRLTGNRIVASPWSAYQFVDGGGAGRAVQNVTVDGGSIEGAGTFAFQAETTGSATVTNVRASGIGRAGVYNCAYPGGTFALNRGAGNSGWDSTWNGCTWVAPGSGGGTDPLPPTGNLAAGKPVSASSQVQNYVPGNTVDGNATSYWESANNAWPQSLTVDLGSSQNVKRLVLKLPPSSAWGARTQTIAVHGSSNGSTYNQLAGAAGRTFDPGSGNTATITLPAVASARHVRLTFTGNTGWPAGQLSEYEVYGS
ncbi:coagulation factor 5/8 type domain protein [Kribbella flavida DSM 17836]|uniref:Coagulation factor 5/8 type domain protein n=1 Tax=Kribbella flavida (strain DSM 17836 / JCM 10339 / NBRC 14399) TaxID=479435 RepID=D2PQH0_KRIFD|nr:discoidin domain-containing protein [Kribbella flavida]ADB29157.1 coagulation factor 5/8 type domain protein [Kribbella flavida DSM 17836]